MRADITERYPYRINANAYAQSSARGITRTRNRAHARCRAFIHPLRIHRACDIHSRIAHSHIADTSRVLHSFIIHATHNHQTWCIHSRVVRVAYSACHDLSRTQCTRSISARRIMHSQGAMCFRACRILHAPRSSRGTFLTASRSLVRAFISTRTLHSFYVSSILHCKLFNNTTQHHLFYYVEASSFFTSKPTLHFSQLTYGRHISTFYLLTALLFVC
mmetsp:Transcript_3997/g.11565  ORF Transcript_3997/g.11565 Transcript_3997/m.11565 type:complete len:218 (-) Transcript_3997:90-743(-)